MLRDDLNMRFHETLNNSINCWFQFGHTILVLISQKCILLFLNWLEIIWWYNFSILYEILYDVLFFLSWKNLTMQKTFATYCFVFVFFILLYVNGENITTKGTTFNYRRLLPNKHRRQSYCNPVASIQVAKSMKSRRRNRNNCTYWKILWYFYMWRFHGWLPSYESYII